MKKNISYWIDLVSGKANLLPLENVIYNIMTLLLTILGIGGLVILFSVDSDSLLRISMIIVTFCYVGYFLWGRFKGMSDVLAIITAISVSLFGAFFWFMTGGSRGPMWVGMIMIFIVCLTFLPARTTLFWVIFNIVLISIILALEMFNPGWILPISEQLNFLGLTFLITGAGTIVGMMIWIFKNSYSQEEERVIQKNEELNDFAHTVSHDMKAPLRAIQHLSSFVLEDNQEALGEEGSDMLKKVSFSADRMTVLINDILNYTRISENVEDKTEILLETLIAEVISVVNPTQVALITYRDLPENVNYNRTILHQVIQNLLSNAIKYNDKDQAEIEITGERRGNFVWISVQDNGPGIAPEHQQKVFEFLKTLGNKSRNESGTGIGLSLVKKVVEQNGGEIRLDSEVGKGARFSFSIPA